MGQRAWGIEQGAEGIEQRAEGMGHRAEGMGQRAEGIEQNCLRKVFRKSKSYSARPSAAGGPRKERIAL